MTEKAIDPGVVPVLSNSVDWGAIKLTREEGFLLSRIDGISTLGSILKASGMAEAKAKECFQHLQELGLIGSGDAPTKAPPPAESPPGVDPSLDLSEDAQREILALVGSLDAINYYELLQTDRWADAATIKRAYFKISKIYHPDSYFRKKLGPFKSKIETIFKRVTKAYEVLSDDGKRAAYDKTLPHEPSPEENAQAAELVAEQERDQRLRDEKRRRILRRSPVAQRRAQAEEHFQEAQALWKKKDAVGANNAIRLALALVPDHPEYLKLLEEVGPKAGQIRAEQEYKRGRYEESMGSQEQALSSFLRAIEAYPDDQKSLVRAAVLLLGQKRDLKTALAFARRAQALQPEAPECTKIVADLYYEMGMHKNALREYTKYINLNPFDEETTSRIHELKRL